MQKSFLNRLRGWLMRLPISRLRHGAFLFLSILVTWVSMTSAQEKPGAPNHSSFPAANKSPDTKKQPSPEVSASTDEQSSVENKAKDKDSPGKLGTDGTFSNRSTRPNNRSTLNFDFSLQNI